MISKEFFEALGLVKTFKIKGKKYKWTCTYWQFILIMLGSVAGFYVFVLSFFALDMIING